MPGKDDRDGLKSRFEETADEVPQILWSVDADGNHDYVNRQLREFVGERIDKVDAETWTSLIHPADRERVEALGKKFLASNEPYEIEYRLLHHSGEYRWLRLKASPKLDADGRVVRWYGSSTDIDEEKSLSLQQELIARELDHRIKNIFALVNGLVSLSARESPEFAPVLNRLRHRIEALNNAHQFVRNSATSIHSAKPAGLKGLLEALLRPYAHDDGTSVARIVGDDVAVDAGQVTSFALLIHELATNSVKYGALASPGGKVSIRILCRAKTLRMRWAELAAEIPAYRSPGTGFGSTLLKLVVEKQLRGRVLRRQGRGYLCYALTLPSM
jgi:PAS domain S-box-containing protein